MDGKLLGMLICLIALTLGVVLGIAMCFVLILTAGCTQTQPEYFYANQGQIVYENNLDHPANTFWMTVYGYTLPSGEIHLKKMNPIDYLLTLGTDVKLHEQAHSFEFIIRNNRREEWLRFRRDYDGYIEEFARDVTAGRNQAVQKFISGEYKK